MQIKQLYETYKQQEEAYKQAKKEYETVLTNYNIVNTYKDVLANDDLSMYEPEQIRRMQIQLNISECLIEEVTDLESIVL